MLHATRTNLHRFLRCLKHSSDEYVTTKPPKAYAFHDSKVNTISAMSAPPTILIAKRPVLIVFPDGARIVVCQGVFIVVIFIGVLVTSVGVATRALPDQSGGRRSCWGRRLVTWNLGHMSV